jgi:putative transposase
MCRVLEVSRSGYYAWRHRKPSAGAQRRQELVTAIRAVHAESDENYGSPRVHRELVAQAIPCSKNTVAKLMRQHQVRSRMRRRFRVRTTDSNHDYKIPENTLNRQFRQEQPNRVWAADITYIPTQEGWLYLAAIMDLYSRRIVGWATADHLKCELALEALEMALTQRAPTMELLHHSDRGVQYACDDYQAVLARHAIRSSMSRTADCYDNAAMESFFATLKTELVYHHDYHTRGQARQSLFEYIEVFYNRKRRHSSLGYQSPHAFEQAAQSRKNRNRNEGRGGPGERGLVSPGNLSDRAAQPLR